MDNNFAPRAAERFSCEPGAMIYQGKKSKNGE
jgi:hypothetical protein